MKITLEELQQTKWQDRHGENIGLSPFKVIAYGEKWVMMRRKGCAPMTAHINSMGEDKQYQRIILTPPK